MKRIFGLLALCALLFAAPIAAQTITRTFYSGNPKAGEIISSGTISWSLVTFQAAADSSIVAGPVCDFTGANRLPGRIVFSFSWSGVVGGGSTTSIQFRPFSHATATEAAGAKSTIGSTANGMYLGYYSKAGAYASIFTITNTAAGSCGAYLCTGAGATTPLTNPPRFMSFQIDKEGDGRFTAGTVTLEWYAYAQ